jgi:hypothetical protein
MKMRRNYLILSMPGSQGYGEEEAVALMRFSEELAFVAKGFLCVCVCVCVCVRAVELGSERSPWYQSMLLLYEISYLICNCLPSCI